MTPRISAATIAPHRLAFSVRLTLGVSFIVVRAGSNVAQETPNDDYLRLGPIAAKQVALFSLHLLDSP